MAHRYVVKEKSLRIKGYPFNLIFRYLNEFLYGWLISALTRAENISLNQELANENLKHRSGVNKRNKTKKKKNRSNSCEIIMCQALQNICGGFYKVIFSKLAYYVIKTYN